MDAAGEAADEAQSPTSPGAPIDGMEVARRMIAATEAAAQAASSSAAAVELLRKQSEEKAGRDTDWFKLLPKPGPFEPKTREQEVSRWRDWWWTVHQYLCTLDNNYETDIKQIESKLAMQQDLRLMDEPEKKRAVFLYGLLASLLRGRLLSILKSINDSNGYEALRLLMVQCQPSSRNRSLGILNALMSWGAFDMKASLLSQITKLEDGFKEYNKISQQAIGEEMKFAILLRCVTGQLKMHLNVSLKEDSSYEALREMILQYDRANIRWTDAMALGTSGTTMEAGNEAVPMDIDRVKGKDKSKGKKGKSKVGKDSKGNGKVKGDGKTKGKVKGKSKDYGKSYSGAGQGKGKTLPGDTCRVCGEKGHCSRECPKRAVRQVGQFDAQPAAASPTSTGSSQIPAPVLSPSTTVRRVTYLDLDAVNTNEPFVRAVTTDKVFDMTYSDGNGDWNMWDGPEAGGNAYITEVLDMLVEPFDRMPVETFSKKALGMGGSSPIQDQVFVRGVTKTDEGMTQVVLDSGADMSVLPLDCKHLGAPLPKRSILRDAQGNKMKGGDLRQAEVLMEDETGQWVCLRETFAVSNVSEPLLALGKLLKKGGSWRLRMRR